jgi:hypothetical protein
MRISALAQTDSEHVWIGSNLGLYQYNLISSEIRRQDVASPVISALLADGDKLWIGTLGRLVALDLNSKKIVREFHLSVSPYFIKKEGEHILWAGSWNNGLYGINLDTDEITHFSANPSNPSGIKSNALVSGLIDQGNIWVGYNGGGGFSKYHTEKRTFEHYHLFQKDSINLSAGTITVIAKGDADNMWLGTYGNGIFQFDARRNSYRNWNQEDGLKGDFINSILADNLGGVWISTADGLSFLSAERGTISTVNIDLIFRSNNFIANGIVGCSGKLYFFRNNQIIEISPEFYQPESGTPHVVISGFKIFDRDVVVSGGTPEIVLSYSENFFSFEYSMLRTHPGREVRYASRLSGFEQNWNTGSKNFSGYTNVPHGHYKFEIKCARSDGQWSDILLSVPVRIRPAFWQTWWFRALCAVAIVVGIRAFYLYRIGQIRRIYSIKAKISQDLHDDVGASLSSIHIFSSVAEKAMQSDIQQATEIVRQIKHNSRQVLENMSDIVWSMNTEQNNREPLADRVKNFGSDLLSYKNIECSYHIDEQIEKKLRQPEARKKILLIIKEALNNIAKYSEATHAVIGIELDGTQISIRISDNGKGFDLSIVRMGNGINNMKQRATSLGGSMSVISQPGGGTHIDCRIPINRLGSEG